MGCLWCAAAQDDIKTGELAASAPFTVPPSDIKLRILCPQFIFTFQKLNIYLEPHISQKSPNNKKKNRVQGTSPKAGPGHAPSTVTELLLTVYGHVLGSGANGMGSPTNQMNVHQPSVYPYLLDIADNITKQTNILQPSFIRKTK